MIKVLFLSTYPPRPCGIGIFTHDLLVALKEIKHHDVRPRVAAMEDPKLTHFSYPPEVIQRVRSDQKAAYRHLAEWVNQSKDIDLVHIQHEFGIFGGKEGEQKKFIIDAVQHIHAPIITTFHTIEQKSAQPRHFAQRKDIMYTLSAYSSRIVVMSQRGSKLLQRLYRIPRKKIVIIPHGVPSIPFVSGNAQKKTLRWQDNIILSSFGLIRSGKGYEYIIHALPAVIQKYPFIRYVIIGQAHPANHNSVEYLRFLKQEVKRLDLQKHVLFLNRFYSEKELIRHLQATDIYLTSGLGTQQIVSGTLSWAMAAGRVVVSIRTEHAREALAGGRGILVPLKSPKSFAQAISWLIAHPKERIAIGKRAHAYMRKKSWKHVAKLHENLYQQVCQNK